jgi:murein DD-endopeptidase MepM/ murein hydrolase activator NlpD
MTFIIVPNGGRDLSTHSFEISYRRLRFAGVILALAVVIFLVMGISWVYIASQAARVPGLSAEVVRLEAEQERVDQLADALRRLEAQYNQVREMLGASRPQEPGSIWLPPATGGGTQEGTPRDTVQASIPSAWPLTDQAFITREHLGQIPGDHPGIDIAVAEGSYIRAAGSGIVLHAGEDSIYGLYVRIRHAEGYESLYGHASQLFVEADARVERHEVIALTGNTGTSTAPHLHFEIRKDGAPIDPRTLVQPPR